MKMIIIIVISVLISFSLQAENPKRSQIINGLTSAAGAVLSAKASVAHFAICSSANVWACVWGGAEATLSTGSLATSAMSFTNANQLDTSGNAMISPDFFSGVDGGDILKPTFNSGGTKSNTFFGTSNGSSPRTSAINFSPLNRNSSSFTIIP